MGKKFVRFSLILLVLTLLLGGCAATSATVPDKIPDKVSFAPIPSTSPSPTDTQTQQSAEAEKESGILLLKGRLYVIFLFPQEVSAKERAETVELFQQIAQQLSQNFYWGKTSWDVLEKNQDVPALLALRGERKEKDRIFFFFFQHTRNVDTVGYQKLVVGTTSIEDATTIVESFYEWLYLSSLDLSLE
jgi:hypothetical protein